VLLPVLYRRNSHRKPAELRTRIGASAFEVDNPHPCAFSQQLLGPAQPACPGFEPQHAVSPGPGIRSLEPPKEAAGAESIFLTFPPPSWGTSFSKFSCRDGHFML